MSDDAAGREQIYSRLARRNRMVGWLRIAVPVFGLVILLALLVQIVLANMARDFGAGGIRIARDALIVDAPAYAGVMANGTQYRVVANSASTAIGDGDRIALDNAAIDLERPDGYTMHAEAAAAEFSLSRQTVTAPGVMTFTDSRDTWAQLRDSVMDWREQTLVARDNVHIVFKDGSVLTGAGLVYDAERQIWDFQLVKLTVKSDP